MQNKILKNIVLVSLLVISTLSLIGKDQIRVTVLLPHDLYDTKGKIIFKDCYRGGFISQNLYYVQTKDDKAGIIAKDGKIFIPLEYKYIVNVDSTFYIALNQGSQDKRNYTLLDATGKKAILENISEYYSSNNEYRLKYFDKETQNIAYAVINNDKQLKLLNTLSNNITWATIKDSRILYQTKDRMGALVDTQLNYIMPETFQYERLEFFEGDLLISRIRNGEGIVDISGNIVLEHGYRRISAHDNYNSQNCGIQRNYGQQLPLRVIEKEEYVYGLVDYAGQVVIPAEYSCTEAINDSTFIICKRDIANDKIKKYGFASISPSFKELIPCEYDYIRIDYEKYAYLENSETKVSMVYDFTNKKMITNNRWINTLQEGLWATCSSNNYGKWGIVNRVGEKIVPEIYTSIEPILPKHPLDNKKEDPRYSIVKMEKNSKWGLLDTLGTALVIPEYDNIIADPKNTEIIKLEKDKKYQLYANKKVYPQLFDQITPLNDTLVKVELNGKFGIMNTDGKIIIPVEHEKILFGNLYKFLATYDNKVYQLHKHDGENINDIKYAEIEFLNSDFARVMVGFRDGIIDKKGNTVLPAEYRHVKRTIYANTFWVADTSNRWNMFSLVNDTEWKFVDQWTIKEPQDDEYYIENLITKNTPAKHLLENIDDNIYIVHYNSNYKQLVNKKGKKIIPTFFQDIMKSEKKGHLIVKTEDLKIGVIDYKGKQVIPLSSENINIEYIEAFGLGYYKVTKSTKKD